MKLLKKKDQDKILNALGEIIKTLSDSDMILQDVNKCVNELEIISHTSGGEIDAQLVFELIKAQRDVSQQRKINEETYKMENI